MFAALSIQDFWHWNQSKSAESFIPSSLSAPVGGCWIIINSKHASSRPSSLHAAVNLYQSLPLSSTWPPQLSAPPLSSAVWRTAAGGRTGGPGGAAAWRPCVRSSSSARWPARPEPRSPTAAWSSSTRPAHSAVCCLYRLLLRGEQHKVFQVFQSSSRQTNEFCSSALRLYHKASFSKKIISSSGCRLN